MTELERWQEDKGDETLRLDYDLNEDSVVFDFGGYEGAWSQEIWDKYKSNINIFEIVPEFASNINKRFSGNKKIKVHDYGLSNKDLITRVGVDGNISTIYSPFNSLLVEARLRDVVWFFKFHNIDNVDLIKINIEGGEYDLLTGLIDSGLIKKIKNIQVQFHDIHPKCECAREEIANKLKITHKLTYKYDWIWESWENKYGYSQVGQESNPSFRVSILRDGFV